MRGKLADSFALGIIDKDKKDLDYLNEFDEAIQIGNLFLFKHRTRHHYLIQISPATERFILDNAAACGIIMSDYDLPHSLSELMSVSKKTDSKKDHCFKRLFRDIQNIGSPEFTVLTNWILYLKTQTYQADMNELRSL